MCQVPARTVFLTPPRAKHIIGHPRAKHIISHDAC